MKAKAIVLAAGKSKRMGSNKLLLKVGGKTIIEHLLDKLSPLDTIVVLGHRPEQLKQIILNHGAKPVYNTRYELGMTTSFQAGLHSIEEDVEAVFLILSDTFGFNEDLLDRMLTKMEITGALIVSPVYEGIRGHPALISSKLFPEFKKMTLNETIKDILSKHEMEHMFVNGDIWTTLDLDTPYDYERLKKLWGQ
jgi:molybdenum cofactor cytidylyltransferase